MFADQGSASLIPAIGLGLLPVLFSSVFVACTVEESPDEGAQASQGGERAITALVAAEQRDSPCEGLDLAEGSISAAEATKQGLTARFEALRRSCAESLCRELANTYDGGTPSKVAVTTARQIIVRHARDKLYDGQGPCLDVAQRCLRYQMIQAEVGGLRDMINDPLELQNNYAKIVDAVRRNDAVLQELLPPAEAQILLQTCRDNAYRAAKSNMETSAFATAEALFMSALACDRELSSEAAWNKSKLKRLTRDVDRVTSRRAEAERRAGREAAAARGGAGPAAKGKAPPQERDEIALMADIVRKMAKDATPEERRQLGEMSEFMQKMEEDPRFKARVGAAAKCVARCPAGSDGFAACATACGNGLQ